MKYDRPPPFGHFDWEEFIASNTTSHDFAEAIRREEERRERQEAENAKWQRKLASD